MLSVFRVAGVSIIFGVVILGAFKVNLILFSKPKIVFFKAGFLIFICWNHRNFCEFLFQTNQLKKFSNAEK